MFLPGHAYRFYMEINLYFRDLEQKNTLARFLNAVYVMRPLSFSERQISVVSSLIFVKDLYVYFRFSCIFGQIVDNFLSLLNVT